MNNSFKYDAILIQKKYNTFVSNYLVHEPIFLVIPWMKPGI